jgi:hypothetical protein
VIDSKQYRGHLQLDRSGRLWHGLHPLAPTLRAVSFEADRAAQVLADPDVVVVPTVAVHGAQIPWGKVVIDGVPVVPARRLPSMLRQLPAVLGPERVADLAKQVRVGFPRRRLTRKTSRVANGRRNASPPAQPDAHLEAALTASRPPRRLPADCRSSILAPGTQRDRVQPSYNAVLVHRPP